jgi:hypothetical protein
VPDDEVVVIEPTGRFDVPVALTCSNCNRIMPLTVRSHIVELLVGKISKCPSCDATVDVWSRLVSSMEFRTFGFGFAGVGANTTHFSSQLVRDRRAVLDFGKLGIPSEAAIEQVAMTPHSDGADAGWLHPVLLHTPKVGHPAKEPVVVYPVPYGGGADTTEINVLIVWTEPGPRQPATDLLMAAVRADQNDDRFAAVIAANAAVEVAVGSTISGWLEMHGIGKQRGDAFLSNDATYGSQLAVLLPIVCAEHSVPSLPADVIAALQRLRSLRNQAAHGALRTDEIEQRDVARGLAGAAVGVTLAVVLQHLARAEPEDATSS